MRAVWIISHSWYSAVFIHHLQLWIHLYISIMCHIVVIPVLFSAHLFWEDIQEIKYVKKVLSRTQKDTILWWWQREGNLGLLVLTVPKMYHLRALIISNIHHVSINSACLSVCLSVHVRSTIHLQLVSEMQNTTWMMKSCLATLHHLSLWWNCSDMSKH